MRTSPSFLFRLFVAVSVLLSLVLSSQGQTPGGWELVDSVVADAIRDGKLPGAVVLVGQRDRILFRKAYGDRALEPSRETMTVDTVFDVASLTKPVATAFSVMKLVERGSLSLDDRIGEFIPEIEDEQAKRVTLRQLLTHVSGYAPDFDLGRKWSGREGMLEQLRTERLRYPPGTRFVYSDIGFIVLGEVVRRVSGRPLEDLSAENFSKLRMHSTGFRPLAAGVDAEKIAPTEYFSGQQGYLGGKFSGSKEEGSKILRGEVHDPTSYRMGGVAGHAGLFSKADDLARFCRMMLSGGVLEGERVLSPYTVGLMTRPFVVSEGGWTRGLGWDIDTRFSSNRGELFPLGSYGHTGFTGTGIWIDPLSGTYVIFLSNRVHPDGKGDVGDIRSKISTIAASLADSAEADARSASEAAYASKVASQIPAFAALSNASRAGNESQRVPINGKVLSGIDVLEKNGAAELRGMKVGLVTNHTGRSMSGRSTIDVLFESPDVELTALFAPEHGIRGELDQPRISDSRDEVTGLPVYSLYGESRRPGQEQLKPLDAVVFDIQDIGTRFYTYISTLRYVLEEAAKAGKPVFVLDRPNPVNGVTIEGTLAEEISLSFTAPHTIPVRHGMTVGELALMMNIERSIGADVRVVKLEGWQRSMWFDETGREWINPSPNMRSLTQATLYPGIGLLETTNLSVGRGTDTPFEIVGAPWMDGRKVAKHLNDSSLKGVRFVPVSFIPKASAFTGEKCSGINLIITDRASFESVKTGTAVALALRKIHPSDWDWKRYPLLLASDSAAKLFREGTDLRELEETWSRTREEFSSRRARFLLYK